MAGLTISRVRSWEPATLQTSASSLRTVASKLEHEVSGLRTAMDTASQQWTGPAAQAASTKFAGEVRTGRSVVDALEAARTALSTGSSELTSTKSHLLTLVARAEHEGLEVGDDGSVTSPTLPPAESESALAARNQRQTALNQKAEAMSTSIGQALRAVDEADAKTATALTGIEVPASLSVEVQAMLERLRTSKDLVSALGSSTAGALALAKSLKKAWSLFGKTKAFGSFLTNTFGQLKNYPGALRFLAGSSAEADIAAFARFATLGKGVDAAMDTFKFGKVGGLLSKIPGLAGVSRIAGKVFLPATVATGLIDTVTGGGYDGARGWATRGFGLAGAAGGGALLASSAGLVALGPVGVGIAGAAVLGYGAWTLGNYVYDHWGDITDFAGKAGGYIADGASAAWDATTGAVSEATDWAGDQLSSAADTAKDFGKSALDTVSFGLL